MSSAKAITKDNSDLIGPDGSRDLNTDLSLVVTKDNSDLIAAESRGKNVIRKSEAFKSAIISKLEQNDKNILWYLKFCSFVIDQRKLFLVEKFYKKILN